jgi:putative ATPase
LDIPKHLDSQHVGYLYPHDFGGWVKQEYLTKPLRVYESSNVGYEKTLNEWLLKIKNQD